MPRKPSPTLTDAELRLMEVLWDRREATVADVVAALSDPPLAYNTVLTTLRILEDKGYVAHDKRGRAFVYRPCVDRRSARHRAVRVLLERFFDDSPEQLVLNLFESDDLDLDELERLKRVLDEDDDDGEDAS